MTFCDRRDAGRRLAARLRPLAAERPIVIALARGGAPVAAEVARALGAPLDILVVRKLGAPRDPEFAFGAVAEDGEAVIDPDVARRVGVGSLALDAILARESQELHRRVALYRGRRRRVEVRDRTVIVVDDGLATGLTDLAAVRALRARGAGRIVVASPVGSTQALALLGCEADEVICHTVARMLDGVGRWYADFAPVSDDEVLAALDDRGAAEPPDPHPVAL